MKLSFKINLLFTGIVSCILLGMALLIFNISRKNVQRDFRDRIRSRAERAAYLYGFFKNDTTNLLKNLDANSPGILFNRNISIYDSNFHERYEFHDAGAGVLSPHPQWLSQVWKDGEHFFSAGEKTAGLFRFNNSILVMVAAEDISGKSYINNLRRIFYIYFPIAVVVTLLAGYLFSRNIVRPVRKTIHDVKLITSQNLSHRLYSGRSRDELAELNETFNSLLNRLEESFAMEKRFISNASHELSTPLTSISSQIEVALLQGRTPEEYRKVLSSVLKDARGLHQLTRNLLEIARAGTHGSISLDKVRIDEILIKAHSDILRQDSNYKVELAFNELPENENECMVFGNASLLSSAFKNIIENGCKYSPDNKTRVELYFRDKETEILFTNQSDILSAEEKERLFEPFYRGSNAQNKSGVGLGLTLTRRIIGLHKGSLGIRSEADTGTTISVVLPTLKK